MCKQSASKSIIKYFGLIVFFILQFPIAINAQTQHNKLLRQITEVEYPDFIWGESEENVERKIMTPIIDRTEEKNEISIELNSFEKPRERFMLNFKDKKLTSTRFILNYTLKPEKIEDDLMYISSHLGEPIVLTKTSFLWQSGDTKMLGMFYYHELNMYLILILTPNQG